MIVGEYPSMNDEAEGVPFAGWTGTEFGKMLSEAGILRGACFLTAVVRVRPPANSLDSFIAKRKMDITPQHAAVRDKMCLPPVWEGIDLLKREIEMCRPNVIIACGNLAMWALTGNWGITSWRGSVMQTDLDLALPYKPKVVAAYAPGIVMRQWSWRQILVRDLRRAVKESLSVEYLRPQYRFVLRPQYSTVIQYLHLLLRAVEARPTKLAVDIETRAGHIACIGVAWSKLEALCIPLMCVERPEGYWPLDQEVEVSFLLYKLLTHANAVVIGQNFSYDAQYFHRWLCFIPRLVRDTMIAQHCCFSNMQKSLDFLSSMYCESHLYWKEDGKTWDEKTGEDQLWEYNCMDAVITYEVDEVEQKTVATMGLQAVHDFQQKLFWPVLRTMNYGIRVAAAKRGEFAMRLSDEIAAREQWLIDVIGHPLNPASPLQMQELFYGQLGFKPIINRKSGTVTCDDEALGKLADREPLVRPLVRKVLELRSLNVYLSTFVNAPLDSDGRIRCSFNIAGTETYRFSSSKNAFSSGLNLQNIPPGGETDGGELQLPNIRELFIPDAGCEFFDIDLNSADLSIVVWEADESEAKAILQSGEDFYSVVGKEFYKDPGFSKKDPRRNRFFKPFCHGTNYLGTAKGLAERLGISVHEADRTQKWYFGKFPGIKRWQEDIKDQVYKRRMVQNVFGYRTYYFDRIEGTIFNQAIAWIPQSTIACLINRAYVNIDANLPQVKVLLQVHDSLAGQYPIAGAEATRKAILANASITLPYSDPLTIGVGLKTSTSSWGACG
jgi:DNA polymerase I-like protein with 3'-5' exonuclease and polymerase domains/uracil-DNA glycosylase